MLSDDAGALLFDHMDQRAALRSNDRVQQGRRDGYHQTEYGGDQGLGDTASHGLRITGTEQGDGLEGRDHTDNRTQQAQQRRHH